MTERAGEGGANPAVQAHDSAPEWMADAPCVHAAPDEYGICEACGWPQEEHRG